MLCEKISKTGALDFRGSWEDDWHRGALKSAKVTETMLDHVGEIE